MKTIPFEELSQIEMFGLLGGASDGCMSELQKEASDHIRMGDYTEADWDEWADRFELCAGWK